MKIEVGKTYRNRLGRVVTIHERLAQYGITNGWIDDEGVTYGPNGHLLPDREDDMDLVEEVPAEPAITNADLIRAVLDGKTVQRCVNDEWQDLSNPRGAIVCLATSAYKVRLKPESMVRWLAITKDGDDIIVSSDYVDRANAVERAGPGGKLLRLEIDGDLNVLDQRTEAP